VKVAAGEVRERLVFAVCDDLLDDCVLAVLSLDDGDVVGAVGDDGEVAPVGPQLGLRADKARAPDGQPPVAVGGLGDLRLTVFGVVDGLPGVLVDRGADGLDHPHPDRVLPARLLEALEDLRVPKPESARSSFSPVAPAWFTRAISSSVKRLIPFWVFADPSRRRMCNVSRVSARVARIGW
jgi:hypothetical protein